MKQRLIWLDALKGIGILSIMRVHMMGPMEQLQSWIYVGAVAMFFVLAGFNLKFSFSTKDAIIGKIKRLLIPYFVYSIFLLLVEHHLDANTLVQIGGILYGRASVGKEAGAQGLMLIGNGPMWFLLCMFLSYIWVYVIYRRCKNMVSKTLCLTCFVLLSAVMYFLPIRMPWSLDTSFVLSALLCIGYEFRNRYMQTEKLCIIVALALWILLFYTTGGYNISIGDYGKFGALSIIPFIFIVLAETYTLSGLLQMIERTWFAKVLAYIGGQSLRLMCIHLVIYIKVESLLASHLISLHDNKWTLLSISFIMIFLINAIIDFIIRRITPKYSICKYL